MHFTHYDTTELCQKLEFLTDSLIFQSITSKLQVLLPL